jgi:Flp pilus assembly protein protease CpaA
MAEQVPPTGRGARLLAVAASSALLLCVCGYALNWAGGGTAAGIAALLFYAGALSRLSEDGRRLRDGRPEVPRSTS